MQKADFQIGLTIKYDNMIGDVQFVSEDYITFCVSEKPSHCPNSLHPTTKVCQLIYTKDWENCTEVVNTEDSVISPVSTYKAQMYRPLDIQ